MKPRHLIPIVLVVLAGGVATWTWGGAGGGAVAAVAGGTGQRSPVSTATVAVRVSPTNTVVATVPAASQTQADPIGDSAPTPATAEQTHPAAPIAGKSVPTPVAAAAVIPPAPVVAAARVKTADTPTPAPYVDPALAVIAAMTNPVAKDNAGLAMSGGGSAGGGVNNLAPLPGGAGLVINDGRIPVGFVIDPREYINGVLHITNSSGTPAILTINDPAAAAACFIAGQPVEAGKPYQVDGLEITAAHPVTVFVQPGRAPGPPPGPRAPHSDG